MSYTVNGAYRSDKLLTKTQLTAIVSKTITSKYFFIVNVALSKPLDKSHGFLGDHFKMAVTVTADGGDRTLNYFLKAMPTDNALKVELIASLNLAKNEALAYQLIQSFKSFLGNAPWVAECYHISDTILVFDDVNIKGYESKCPRDPTKEHCMAALTSVAKLQACSLISEEIKSSELGVKFRFHEEYDFGKCIYIMEGFFKIGCETMLEVAKELSIHAKDKQKLKLIGEKWVGLWEMATQQGEPSPTDRNVIAHRDLWSRNLMYRYENGVPQECILVDFQFVGILPSAADVMSVIYNNSDRSIRDNHGKRLLEHFYQKLSEHLINYNYKPENILQKSAFMEQCVKYKLWGMVHQMCIHLTYLDSKHSSEMIGSSDVFNYILGTVQGRKELVLKAMKEDNLYRNKILENINEFIETFILNK